MSDENINPVGEGISEFAKGDKKGPFNCGNCIHMRGGCRHPVVQAEWTSELTKEGLPDVESGDCCKYVRRPGDE